MKKHVMKSETASETFFDANLKLKAYKDWMEGKGENFDEETITQRRKRIILNIIDGELTDTQKLYFMDYFANGTKLADIAEKYGVNKSTVSRTMKRAFIRIHRILKYIAPELGVLITEDMKNAKRSFFRKK